MKKVIIVSSPGTQFEVVQEKTVYAPENKVYFMQEGDLEFSKTQEQSEQYIKSLESQLQDLKNRINQLKDILIPGWDDPEYDE